jgi:mono/diheme cytochrome c family protein
VIALLLMACGGPSETVDTGLCADAPVVTWETFGEGFLRENCQACHASTAVDRGGAPADVTFDTQDDALRWRTRILERAAGAAPTMPPQGGTTDEDRWRLQVWLACGGE